MTTARTCECGWEYPEDLWVYLPDYVEDPRDWKLRFSCPACGDPKTVRPVIDGSAAPGETRTRQ